MKLGCHAVLFKEQIKTNTDSILSEFASMGADGFEMGSRFFGTEEKSSLQKKLEQHNIQLSAMHVGAPLVSWENDYNVNMQNTLKVADFMKDMRNKNVLMSGNRKKFRPDANFKAIAMHIEETAKRCLDIGVTLNYHNHDIEFANNGEVYKYLAEYAPSLHFAFDLGWVYVGGYDPFKVLDEQKDRIQYLHLRDPISVGNFDFADLGKGIFDMKKIVMAANTVLGKDDWCVVEYEKGDVNMERYRSAMTFVKSVL